jgi:hypothetical protein
MRIQEPSQPMKEVTISLQCDRLSTGAGAMAGARRQQEQRQGDHGDHRKKGRSHQQQGFKPKTMDRHEWQLGATSKYQSNKQRQW